METVEMLTYLPRNEDEKFPQVGPVRWRKGELVEQGLGHPTSLTL